MNRYTEKSTDIRDKGKYEYTMITDKKPYWTYVNEDGVTLYERIIRKAFEKLGKLEDVEEELGIDLITLFKALKNGVYWKKPNGEVTFFLQNLRNAIYLTSFKGEFYFTFVTIYEYTKLETLGSVNIVDYGVTWALTKEELE